MLPISKKIFTINQRSKNRVTIQSYAKIKMVNRDQCQRYVQRAGKWSVEQ